MSASGNPLSADGKSDSDLDHILEHTRSLWEEARGARFFVTGGTGFFGCWLLESFAWANERLSLGAEMLVLTRNLAAFQKKAPQLANRADIRFQVGDARDFEFPSGEFSHVIHAATDTNAKLNNEQPALKLDTIISGTRRALEFAARSGTKKFLLTSSGAIYGNQPSDLFRVSEDYAGGPNVSDPRNTYAEGKRISELLCAISSRQHKFEPKIARCFAFVGPYLPLDAHFAIGNFIGDATAGRSITINGDGTPYRSYLYAADLAIWLWTILFRGTANRPYNVGSANPVNIAETAAAVSRALPGNVPVNILQKPVPGQPAQRYVPDTTRAQSELGLKQFIQLDDAIQRTARWHSRI